MSIYTRAGDGGSTSLFGGKHVSKSNPIIVACGEIDELNSFIGLVKNQLKKTDQNNHLFFSIQKDLYKIMAQLAGNKEVVVDYEKKIKLFEKTIEGLSLNLQPLNNFIIPGNNELSSWFHILRTVCRRAERHIVRLLPKKNRSTIYHLSSIIQYFNRLSDLFFILARFYGKKPNIVIKKQ